MGRDHGESNVNCRAGGLPLQSESQDLGRVKKITSALKLDLKTKKKWQKGMEINGQK